MMPNIKIKFARHNALILQINNTNVGQGLCDLLAEHRSTSLPIYRDRIRYNPRYLLELAKEAKTAFGWQWEVPEYSLQTCVTLHKDLERLLGTTGYQDIDGRYDHLLTEMHYCLHIMQDPASIGKRSGGFQIEWFSDKGFPLDNKYQFCTFTEFGNVELLNPWVGHAPMQIYNEKDNIDINMTCKFHDYVKPGLRISTYSRQIDRSKVLEWFQTYAPDFVSRHGSRQIEENTGWAVIGKVTNPAEFQKILADPEEIVLEDFVVDV